MQLRAEYLMFLQLIGDELELKKNIEERQRSMFGKDVDQENPIRVFKMLLSDESAAAWDETNKLIEEYRCLQSMRVNVQHMVISDIRTVFPQRKGGSWQGANDGNIYDII
jgi:hypothetical protein